jgi:hypothetical protein
MAKKQWISVLGLWIMIFLFLGFPSTWDKWFAVVTGMLIIAISYSMKSERKEPASQGNIYVSVQETFVENQNIHSETPAPGQTV